MRPGGQKKSLDVLRFALSGTVNHLVCARLEKQSYGAMIQMNIGNGLTRTYQTQKNIFPSSNHLFITSNFTLALYSILLYSIWLFCYCSLLIQYHIHFVKYCDRPNNIASILRKNIRDTHHSFNICCKIVCMLW